VCDSQPLDLTVVRLSGAHRTVRCHSSRALVVGLSMQTARCPTGKSGAHQTCDYSLSGAPLVRWLTALFLDIFADSFVLLLFLSLGLLCFLLCHLLRCCIIIALVQSSLLLWTININTSKHISPQAALNRFLGIFRTYPKSRTIGSSSIACFTSIWLELSWLWLRN
jgi:hypothetical protein